jgi:hypothetical protein
MDTNSPPRVYRVRADADTWSLVYDVTDAARTAARFVEWPDLLPRTDAPELAHALAALEVQYKADTADQTIRMPWRVIGERGDCKSTAVLIASLCAAAGHRVQLKFLQYEPGPAWWQHVFAVVDGVPVDPLLPYGRQFPYFRAITTRIR